MKQQVLLTLTTLFVSIINIPVEVVDTQQSVPTVVMVQSEVVASATPSAIPAPTSIPKPTNDKPGEVAGATTVVGQVDGAMVSTINATREEHGLNKLVVKESLLYVAQCRINYLIDNNLWTHDGYQKCFAKKGYSYGFGENLAKDFGMNVSATFTAWMGSAGHRANILEPKWRSIGVVSDGGYTVATFSTSL